MKKYERLEILLANRDQLFKDIKAEAECIYPIGSEVLFKKGNMTDYATGIVRAICFFHGSMELILENENTGIRRNISLYYVHNNYK